MVKYLPYAVRQVEDFDKDPTWDLRHTVRVSWDQPGLWTRTFSLILSIKSASSQCHCHVNICQTGPRSPWIQAWPSWKHQGLLKQKLSSPFGSSLVSRTVIATWGNPQGCLVPCRIQHSQTLLAWPLMPSSKCGVWVYSPAEGEMAKEGTFQSDYVQSSLFHGGSHSGPTQGVLIMRWIVVIKRHV